MENDNSTIKKELDHIRNSINQKNETQSKDDDFILLDKIVSKSNKKTSDVLNNVVSETKETSLEKRKILENENKKNVLKVNKLNKIENNKRLASSKKKSKDPVADLVEREIKPIIKKWISKNLKSFVKTIVIEEMKLISKATQKHK